MNKARIVNYLRLFRLEELLLLLPLNVGIVILIPDVSYSRLVKLPYFFIAIISGYLAGNTLNAISDKSIDKYNPRTNNRPLASNSIKTKWAVLWLVVFGLLVVISTYLIEPLFVLLLPIPIGIGFLYCYSKRFTFLCHFVLGITAAVGPFASWIVFSDNWLCLGSLLSGSFAFLHISAYDLLYSIQDIEFDKKQNMNSLPVLIGEKRTVLMSHLLNIAMYIVLIMLFVYLCFSYFSLLLLIPLIFINCFQYYIFKKGLLNLCFRLNFLFDFMFMVVCIVGKNYFC